MKKAGDARQNIGRPGRFCVGAGNTQGRLAGVTKALGDAGQEQRSAGDRLKMPSGLREPDEQIPPVVDEGDQTGREPAAGVMPRRTLASYVEIVLEAHVDAKKQEGKKPKTRS
jgi:hypothetical protein